MWQVQLKPAGGNKKVRARGVAERRGDLIYFLMWFVFKFYLLRSFVLLIFLFYICFNFWRFTANDDDIFLFDWYFCIGRLSTHTAFKEQTTAGTIPRALIDTAKRKKFQRFFKFPEYSNPFCIRMHLSAFGCNHRSFSLRNQGRTEHFLRDTIES